jgi:hypothetical protein
MMRITNKIPEYQKYAIGDWTFGCPTIIECEGELGKLIKSIMTAEQFEALKVSIQNASTSGELEVAIGQVKVL